MDQDWPKTCIYCRFSCWADHLSHHVCIHPKTEKAKGEKLDLENGTCKLHKFTKSYRNA